MDLSFSTVLRGPRLGRLFGIEILLDWSWFLIAAIFVFSFAGTFGAMGAGPFAALVAAGATAALFFGSILAHEIGHALTARRFGITTRSIRLHLLGGLAQLTAEPRTAAHEFLISFAGPAVSLAIGGAALLLGEAAASLPLVAAILGWLGYANLVLAAFNLLPGFPLDGGRMLRAWLWSRHGSFERATLASTKVGEAFGWMLVIAGIAGAFGGLGFLNGLMLVLLGTFLKGAARAEAFRLGARRAAGAGPAGIDPLELFRRMQQGRRAETPRASRPGTRTVILRDGTEVVIQDPA